ncbi:MAG: hypothetical protein IT318_16675 [Anaerolineales bacterium]|nr:hypothetical protein [Anaerolineales bacterium]
MDQQAELRRLFQADLVERSLTAFGSTQLALVRAGTAAERLAVLAPAGSPLLEHFDGERQDPGGGQALLLAPCTPANARALRAALPNLQPRPLGLAASAGCGDRLGLATPGHVRAFEAVSARPGARPVAAIFAQQSIREMARTNRTPGRVLADATWGAFEAGWRANVGADADHLKALEEVEACAAEGFSFYTFDPGAHVDSRADADDPAAIERKVAALPWAALETTPGDFRRRYAGRRVDLGDRALALETGAVLRAAAKYGRAIAHVAALYRHLAGLGVPHEVEVSVDETETPTTHAEHVYFASELRRLGVSWVSLAPRYVGRFEKGIDYLGDLDALRADLAGHAAIARALGPYKLSLHSGSDKFSVYPIITGLTEGRVHLKTAGTSYLEALRVLAAHAPRLFREIAALAAERYLADRATYHVSAELSDWVDLAAWPDAALPELLEHPMRREILHVTFGSALAGYGAELTTALKQNREAYAQALEKHFTRHLAPLAGV